jgi:CheY-like chemotaxis protein
MTVTNQESRFDILLVDDSPADAKIFQEALLEVSARVRLYWVGTGEEALDFLTQQGRFRGIGPVKMVVLDLNMPGLDGIETLRRIKMNPSISRIPAVVFSSSRAPQEVDRAYATGANAFFSKPLSLENYVQKAGILVRHWLDYAELPTPVEARTASLVESIEDHRAS